MKNYRRRTGANTPNMRPTHNPARCFRIDCVRAARRCARLRFEVERPLPHGLTRLSWKRHLRNTGAPAPMAEEPVILQAGLCVRTGSIPSVSGAKRAPRAFAFFGRAPDSLRLGSRQRLVSINIGINYFDEVLPIRLVYLWRNNGAFHAQL